MNTKPQKPSLPPRLEKRQKALGKNPLGKLLGKLPGVKKLTTLQQQKVDHVLSAHKGISLEKETLRKAQKTFATKPQKLAAGGAAKVRLGQAKVKGIGSSLRTPPKLRTKS